MRPWGTVGIIEAFCTEGIAGAKALGHGQVREARAWWGRVDWKEGRARQSHNAGSPSGSLRGCDKTMSPLLIMLPSDFLTEFKQISTDSLWFSQCRPVAAVALK